MNFEIERYEGELRELRQAAAKALEVLNRFTTMKTPYIEGVISALESALKSGKDRQ